MTTTDDKQPSITCPVCNRTSHSPQDIAHGYCGYCHDFTSLGEVEMPEKSFHLDQPNHPDFFRLAAIVKILDRQTRTDGFASTIKCDIPSLGYMANVRAGLIQQELADAHLNEETIKEGMEIAPEEAERERLVMCWMDAFCAGQRFHAAQEVREAASGIAEEEANAPQDGNRRQRRLKKRR